MTKQLLCNAAIFEVRGSTRNGVRRPTNEAISLASISASAFECSVHLCSSIPAELPVILQGPRTQSGRAISFS
jgi:hypothetical protein